MNEIRLLRPDEISVKVRTVLSGGKAMLLLYKDARVDMAILDEAFGKMGWQRHHREVKGNLFCSISVWDDEKKCWIEREDVGIESQTEAEKGEASDSFKRAGFNFGIGRELYTAPNIIVELAPSEYVDKRVKTSFFVNAISYDKSRDIESLSIIDGNGAVRYTWSKKQAKGNLPMEEPDNDLEAYRLEVEAMLLACDLIDKDKKALTLKGLPKYDKKLLDAVVERIKKLEKQNG